MFEKCETCGNMTAIKGDCPVCFYPATTYRDPKLVEDGVKADGSPDMKLENRGMPVPVKTKLVRWSR